LRKAAIRAAVARALAYEICEAFVHDGQEAFLGRFFRACCAFELDHIENATQALEIVELGLLTVERMLR